MLNKRILMLVPGLLALGLSLTLTIYLDILGMRTLWAYLPRFAPFALLFSLIAIVGALRLFVERDPVAWVVLGLGVVSGLMTLVQTPLVLADRVSQEWQYSLKEAFGEDWQSTIPEELSMHFLLDPIRNDNALTPTRQVREEVLDFVNPDASEPLQMLVYRPDDDSIYPAIIYIHGGGWLEGGLGQGQELNRYLAGQGYVIIDVDYRYGLSAGGDAYQYPVPMADVYCAISFARDHANRLGLDPERLALMGRSAGGHMALLASYASGSMVEPACANGNNHSVQAVIALYSPTDLEVWVQHGSGNTRTMVTSFLGDLEAETIQALYEETAPVRHVTADAPPTLLIDGARDLAVPPEQHDLLYAALQEAGVPSARLRVPWATHGFDEEDPAGIAGQLTAWTIERFLAKYLGE